MELCAAARKAGVALEAQPFEIQYIIESIGSRPASSIREELGMTKTQFQQICGRHAVKTAKSAETLSLSEVTDKTRWLIEKVLKWSIDDELPRKISNTDFVKHALSNVVGYATKEKEEDERFRGFPAVSFLVCTAYPGVFQPYQFRHAKRGNYFKPPAGRQRLLEAVRWIVEEKLGLKVELLGETAKTKGFLRNADLSFYGISPHLYNRYFRYQNDLVEALLRVTGTPHKDGVATSNKLREALRAAGRPPRKCEVLECSASPQAGLDIHHVVPKATRRADFDLHSAPNLVALCPNHHRAARDYPWHSCLTLSMDQRRQELLNFLVTGAATQTLRGSTMRRR
jgi:hypothetical protein